MDKNDTERLPHIADLPWDSYHDKRIANESGLGILKSSAKQDSKNDNNAVSGKKLLHKAPST